MKEKISIDKVSMSTIFTNLVGEEIKGDLSTKKIARAPEYCYTLWGFIVKRMPVKIYVC